MHALAQRGIPTNPTSCAAGTLLLRGTPNPPQARARVHNAHVQPCPPWGPRKLLDFRSVQGHSALRGVSGGIIFPVAGNAAQSAGYSGDGGAATAARLSYPYGVAVNTAGDVFIADYVSRQPLALIACARFRDTAPPHSFSSRHATREH